MSKVEMQQGSDASTINTTLKTLCRELGVERDRKPVLHIATLFMKLSKNEAVDSEELVRIAREQLMVGFPLDAGTAI